MEKPMKKQFDKKMPKTAVSLALLASLLSPVMAQTGKVETEQQPLPELPNSISGTETVRARMDRFVREQNLREVKDNKKDETGRVVLIDFATATIAAPPPIRISSMRGSQPSARPCLLRKRSAPSFRRRLWPPRPSRT